MERLLLVEHERLYGGALALLLEWRTGLSCVCAGSAAEAKGFLEDAKQKPACVMVDLDLPDREANELLKRVEGIPVLMVLGAVEVLRKGSVEEIAAAVERLIGPRSITF